MPKKKKVTFPLTFDEVFNLDIDEAVHEAKKINRNYTKQQFCLDAIREKVEREKISSTRGEINNGI